MNDVANSTNQIQFCLFASGGKISAPGTRSLFTFPVKSTLNFPPLTGTHDATCKANLPWAVHLVVSNLNNTYANLCTFLGHPVSHCAGNLNAIANFYWMPCLSTTEPLKPENHRSFWNPFVSLALNQAKTCQLNYGLQNQRDISNNKTLFPWG